MDPESLSRLHPRVSLLLRPQIPDVPRARPRRRVLVPHPGQGELRRRAAPGAGSPDVAGGAHRVRYGHRPVSTDRRTLPADPARPRGARRSSLAGRPHHQGADGGARPGPAGRAISADHLHRAHERADGRRRGVAGTRARHRAPAPAAARRPHAGRRGGRRRRAHGAGRARSDLTAGEARTDHQGDCRPRCAVLRRECDASGGRHTRPLHAVSVAGVPRPRATGGPAVRGQIRLQAVPGPGARRAGAAASALRATRGPDTVTATGSGRAHPGPARGESGALQLGPRAPIRRRPRRRRGSSSPASPHSTGTHPQHWGGCSSARPRPVVSHRLGDQPGQERSPPGQPIDLDVLVQRMRPRALGAQTIQCRNT